MLVLWVSSYCRHGWALTQNAFVGQEDSTVGTKIVLIFLLVHTFIVWGWHTSLVEKRGKNNEIIFIDKKDFNFQNMWEKYRIPLTYETINQQSANPPITQTSPYHRTKPGIDVLTSLIEVLLYQRLKLMHPNSHIHVPNQLNYTLEI